MDVSEWNRMKGKLSSWKNPAPSKASLLQQHKQLLHKHSQKIVHNWQNTIEGQRLKKLQARRLKDEQEEVSLLSYCSIYMCVCSIYIIRHILIPVV